MSKVWFITGTSKGFGRIWAEAALERGDKVAATARSRDAVADLAERYGEDNALPLALDVTDTGAIDAAVKQAHEHFGRLDVVVNNAGYGLFGALEELAPAQVRDQFETNVFGVLNVTRAVLPKLRRQRSGHVVQISSLSARGAAVAGEGAYAATKFAVEGLSEVLAKEIAHLGIHVTIVEPGPFRTDFATGATATPVIREDYADSVGRSLEWFAGIAGAQPNDPARAAQAIVTAVDADQPPLRLPLGPEAIQAIRASLDEQHRELDAWEHLGGSTGFED